MTSYIFWIALFTLLLAATVYNIIKSHKRILQINVKKLYIENCVYKILFYVLGILYWLEKIVRTEGW